jgi:hypothetical protein
VAAPAAGAPARGPYEGHRFQRQLERAEGAGNQKEIDRIMRLSREGDALYAGTSRGRQGKEFSDPALNSYEKRRDLFGDGKGEDPNAFNASMGTAARGLITDDFDRQRG